MSQINQKAQPRGWIGLSAGEGGVRILTRSIQRLMADFSKTVPGGIVTTLVANGLVTMLIGLVGSKKRKQNIIIRRSQILACMAIGSVSVLMMFLSLRAFHYEGSDMGVVTFIVALSIIPGALLDWIFFKTRLNSRQIFGIVVYALAGWAVLGFPSIGKLLNLPVWVLIGCAIALLFAVNEVLKRKVGSGRVDPYVMCFWTGLVTIPITVLWLTGIGEWRVAGNLPSQFWFWSVILGLTTVGNLSLGQLSYRPWAGGTIARKKVVMWGVYLSGAMVVGDLVYGEVLTVGKGLGVLGFLLAFAMMDPGTWEMAKGLLRRTGRAVLFEKA